MRPLDPNRPRRYDPAYACRQTRQGAYLQIELDRYGFVDVRHAPIAAIFRRAARCRDVAITDSCNQQTHVRSMDARFAAAQRPPLTHGFSAWLQLGTPRKEAAFRHPPSCQRLGGVKTAAEDGFLPMPRGTSKPLLRCGNDALRAPQAVTSFRLHLAPARVSAAKLRALYPNRMA